MDIENEDIANEWWSLVGLPDFMREDEEPDVLYENDNNLEPIDISSVKVGEVYKATFPFLDFEGDKKDRRVIIIDLGDGELRALMVSKMDDKKESKKRKAKLEFNHIIVNPFKQGFTAKVFSVGSAIFNLEVVTLLKRTGTMFPEEYDACMKGVKLFMTQRFDTPWNFLAWLKINLVKPGKERTIQSLQDIERTKSADCVDVAAAVHEICARRHFDHRIVWFKFQHNNTFSSTQHLSVVWKTRKGAYAFRFDNESGELLKGDIESYFDSDFIPMIQRETDFFKEYVEEVTKKHVSCSYLIFDDSDISILDRAIISGQEKEDALNMIKEFHQFTQYEARPYVKRKTITESFTSQILPGDVVPGYPTRIFVKDLGDGSYCFDDTETNMRMRTLNDKENGYTIDNLEANFAKYVPESVEVIDENEPAMEAAKYIDKKLTYSEVKNGIQYIFSDDGTANSYYEIDGEKYRVRVETIVKREVNGTSCVFFEKKDKETHYGTMYKLPGGSVEIDKSLAEQAECEVNEEILCKVKNVHYTGKYYIVKYDKDAIPEWHKRILWPIGLKYVGAISFVFTAEYDGPYKKKVDEKDKDSLAQKGDWYPIWEFEEIKSDIHQGIALESANVVKEASIYTQQYKDFDEFCEHIQTPEEVATWYSRNHVNWPPGETGSDHPFRWPDSIVKHKIGNCYDHALFMHYFCDRKGIPNKQVHSYVILVRRDEKTGKVDFDYCGHIVTLFEKDGRWYEFDPQPYRQKSGTVIEGPFDSIDEYLEDVSEGLELWGRQMNVGYETKSGYYVYSEDEQKVWDKFYNAPIKDRDAFHAKYLSNDNTYEEYKKGKMKPVEQKKYFEHLRVRAAILKFIIRHGIRKMKDEVVSFFNESSNVDAFINHMEVVEESFTTKDNIIPVDYSGYDGIDTRIMCLNTHCLNGLEQVIPLTGLFALLGQPLLGSLIEISAWTAYGLSDQIFAVDIFAVDKNINIRNDCEGLPIIACNDGMVVDSVNDVDNELGTVDRMIRKYGNYVVISHDNGRWFSVYAHLRKGSVIVKAGNKVCRGQKIAELGHSGNSDAKASHLHFEMLWTNVMAKNRPSLLFDLPKTLSGFGEYECTRIPWNTAAQIWIPFNKIEGLKQAYKEPMQPNTSGELSGACFLTETPDKTVEEVYLPIMESAKQFKSSKAKNFEDFCNECKTPEDAMNWFIANKVVWNDKANDDKMRWPDTLVKERKGNCLDQSVMMHFFFKKRHIEHRMALFTIRLENGSTAGHIFPLFKRGKYVYAWLYIGPGHGVITGPYKSWYDAAGQVTEFYKVLILSSPKKQFDSPVSDTTEWSVQEYSETEHLDKYLNKDIAQKDYLYADGGNNLWSTHFFSRDFRFIRIPKITGVLYKLLTWSKQYQTPKDKQVAKEALALIKSDKYDLIPVQESFHYELIHPTPFDLEAIETIRNTFSEDEKILYGGNNEKSPDMNPDVTVFCKIEYDNDTPCAFVKLTDSGKLGLAEGDVNIAFGVHSDYRRRGLAVKLIKDAVHWFKSTNYTTMSFIVRKGNEASYKLAERCGFTFMQYWEKTKEYWFMITNPSMLKAIGESVEQPEVIKQNNTEVDMGICNHVLKYLGNSIDVQKFADIKSGRRFMYTRCKIMKKDIPLVLLLAYCEGLTTVLRKAEVNFLFSDTRPRLKEMEAVRKGVIPFADGYLVYDKFPLEVSLLMNGFGMVDTRGFDYAEMDGKDVYVSLFDILFGTRMLANALDNFYDWMIDPVTFQVLEDLNYPTDFVGLLLAGNKLLADNSFTNELDMRNYRIRSNEMAYAYAFKAISEAYGKFRMTAGNKNPSKISIPQGVVIKDIMQSQVVEDVSELSPIVEVEKQHLCTDKGPSGTNLKEAYTMKRRCYDKSMVGVMAIAQSPDANVGITKTLTLNPNVTNGRGYVKPLEERDLDDSNIFSMAELATPLAMNHDDQIRGSMMVKQSKFAPCSRNVA